MLSIQGAWCKRLSRLAADKNCFGCDCVVCRPTAFLAMARFPAWRNVLDWENPEMVCSSLVNYSDYSVFVKFTNFLQHHTQQKVLLALIHWKTKLQWRQAISVSDRGAGKHHHILQNKGNVYVCSLHLRVHEIFCGHLASAVRASRLVNLLIWKYITCYLIRIASLQCTPPLPIPQSLERLKLDISSLLISCTRLGVFLFAMWFAGFDLPQIHCEFNNFCKKND